MALGYFAHLAGDTAAGMSGGSESADQIYPDRIRSHAREVGVGIAAEYPKPWTNETAQTAVVFVAMGCGDTCPVLSREAI
ncbi:low molecular weight phosphatase family protein [Mycobacteroides abscessus]|uniref:hypothetical protein n=1 Tax=Mycobacteroides abscessus TaxID=36809 RepID=UPI0018A4A185|nr:hypothetical protein [Mycobacteroides abscessus]MBE5459424.1 hypothetical protein [Mycobacteroides abscessus]QOF44129.1 hypothetical protein E3G69_003178 [Mycobacteroides abscessus]QOF48828.1 hypothetical protein E3G70_003177 [Mycobacteroides abscessus]